MIVLIGKAKKFLQKVFPAKDLLTVVDDEFISNPKIQEQRITSVFMLGTDYAANGVKGKELRLFVEKYSGELDIVIIAETQALLGNKSTFDAKVIIEKSKKPDVLKPLLSRFLIKKPEVKQMDMFGEVNVSVQDAERMAAEILSGSGVDIYHEDTTTKAVEPSTSLDVDVETEESILLEETDVITASLEKVETVTTSSETVGTALSLKKVEVTSDNVEITPPLKKVEVVSTTEPPIPLEKAEATLPVESTLSLEKVEVTTSVEKVITPPLEKVEITPPIEKVEIVAPEEPVTVPTTTSSELPPNVYQTIFKETTREIFDYKIINLPKYKPLHFNSPVDVLDHLSRKWSDD